MRGICHWDGPRRRLHENSDWPGPPGSCAAAGGGRCGARKLLAAVVDARARLGAETGSSGPRLCQDRPIRAPVAVHSRDPGQSGPARIDPAAGPPGTGVSLMFVGPPSTGAAKIREQSSRPSARDAYRALRAPPCCKLRVAPARAHSFIAVCNYARAGRTVAGKIPARKKAPKTDGSPRPPACNVIGKVRGGGGTVQDLALACTAPDPSAVATVRCGSPAGLCWGKEGRRGRDWDQGELAPFLVRRERWVGCAYRVAQAIFGIAAVVTISFLLWRLLKW